MKDVTVIYTNCNSSVNKFRNKTLKCATCGDIIEPGIDQFLMIGGEDGKVIITCDRFKCYADHYK